MFSIGDQVEVVGELDGARQFLQDVYAEAFTAQFGVGLCVANNAVRDKRGGEAESCRFVSTTCDQKASVAAGTVAIFSSCDSSSVFHFVSGSEC